MHCWFGNRLLHCDGVLRWINQRWTRDQRRRFENFTEKMELHNQMESDWSRHFNQAPVEVDANANHKLFCSELKSSSLKLESNSNPHCSIWTGADPGTVKSCSGWSFAMDARIRLENLKSGYNSLSDRQFNFTCPKDPWESEPEGDETALDLVELLDLEDDVQDEERW